MYSQILEESSGYIIIAATFRIIRQMQRNTEVETEYENIHVITDTDTRSQSYLFRESLSERQLLKLGRCLLFHQAKAFCLCATTTHFLHPER